jgi:hypothetical protein
MLPSTLVPRVRAGAVLLVGLALATAVWLPCVHLFFAGSEAKGPTVDGLSPRARALAARPLALWGPAVASGERATDVTAMHAASGEWDFMGRTFLAWAFADMALRDPAHQDQFLAAIDDIIADTLRVEQERGQLSFLLPYGRARPFLAQPARTLFVDGELALAIGLRRLVAERTDYKALLDERVAIIAQRMSAGPVMSAESYPDECWTFCNAVALAALRVADVLDGSDHGELSRRWVAAAKDKLVDPATGLLVSRYTMKGDVMEGPEGSSVWMAAHALRVVDPAFAADQYRRARKELGRSMLGFGYAVEWPAARPGHDDIDSGPTIPLLGASAGSSGLALVAAKSFGDDGWFRQLNATLDFAAFPVEHGGELRYAAGSAVGDAVLLYSLVLGPTWARLAVQP